MAQRRAGVLRLLTLLVGAGGMMGQILLLREFMVVAHGNELTIGIVIANWMLLESAGAVGSGRSLASGPNAVVWYARLMAAYGILLPLSLFLTRGVASFFPAMAAGEALSASQLFIASVVLVGPVSAVHGALFPLASRIRREISGDPSPIARIYLHETLGTLLGGVLLTLILVGRFHSLEISLAVSVLHASATVAADGYLRTDRAPSPRLKAVIAGLSLVLLLLVPAVSDSLHGWSLAWRWKQPVLYYYDSPFGNIVTVEKGGEYTFFYDGSPVMTVPSPDTAAIADFVHIVASSHGGPENVLLIGTGLGGVLNELLRHPVQDVRYLELDPELPAIIRRFPTELTERELADPRVSIKHTDGRLYLAQTQDQFDMVVIGFIDPQTLQANRLFTAEFFTIVRERLRDDGLLAFSAPGAAGYMTPETADLNASLYRTAARAFENVVIIPGDTSYFLASPGPIDTDPALLSSRLRKRGIADSFLTHDYLSYRLDPGRRERAEEIMASSGARLNLDFNPAALLYSLTHWGSAFSPGLAAVLSSLGNRSATGYFLLPVVLTLVLGSALRRHRHRKRHGASYALWTSGAAGMAFDLLVLFIFQCLYGYVYRMAGLLVAAFMAGIFAGGTWGTARAQGDGRERIFRLLEAGIAVLLVGLYGVTLLLQGAVGRLSSAAVITALVIYAAVSGAAVGAQFPLAAGIASGDTRDIEGIAGTLYAADLMGGWFGGLAVAIFLFPTIGLLHTLLLLCAFKISSLVVLTVSAN